MMNKFLIVSCLVVAVTLTVTKADLQAATDEQEVIELKDKSVLFRDFCLTTRDYISQDLLSKGKSLVPATVMDLLNDTANRHKNIRTRLVSILNNPSAELMKLDGYVADQQRSLAQRIQERPIQASQIYGRARDIGQQTRGYVRDFLKDPSRHLRTVDNFLAQQQRAIGQRLQDSPIQPTSIFKNAFDNIQSWAARIRASPMALLNETCKAFDQYQEEIVKRFEAAREQLKSQDAGVASLELKDVPCATMRRVNSVREACAEMKKQE